MPDMRTKLVEFRPNWITAMNAIRSGPNRELETATLSSHKLGHATGYCVRAGWVEYLFKEGTKRASHARLTETGEKIMEQWDQHKRNIGWGAFTMVTETAA